LKRCSLGRILGVIIDKADDGVKNKRSGKAGTAAEKPAPAKG